VGRQHSRRAEIGVKIGPLEIRANIKRKCLVIDFVGWGPIVTQLLMIVVVIYPIANPTSKSP